MEVPNKVKIVIKLKTFKNIQLNQISLFIIQTLKECHCFVQTGSFDTFGPKIGQIVTPISVFP